MSYDLRLINPETGEAVKFANKHNLRGGIYVVGGDDRACLNVTYNYGRHYARVFPVLHEARPLAPDWLKGSLKDRPIDGLRTIYGLTGLESIPVLVAACAQLGDDTDPDYWKPTEGNAKAALVNLIALAAMSRDAMTGVWTGD